MNLGNTCFFNSVMQCVMHTHHLQYYFEKFGRVRTLEFLESRTVLINEDKVDLEVSIQFNMFSFVIGIFDTSTEIQAVKIEVPQEDTPLNSVVQGFLGEFRCGTSPSPAAVFSQIVHKAPRFKGWQQQDAHELLRFF